MQQSSKTFVAPRSLRIAVVAALVVACTGFATAAYAQGSTQARVKIDFPFIAAKTEMPAGKYELTVNEGRIAVRPLDGKAQAATLEVVTRLGRHTTDVDPVLIFDKLDGKMVLSEIWFPGLDGYLVEHGTADHQHSVVRASRIQK